MPAIKAGCLTTSEICWDRGFSGFMVSDIRPDASEDGEWGRDWRRCESGIRKDKKGTQELDGTHKMKGVRNVKP